MGNTKCPFKQMYPSGKPKNGKRSVFEDTLFTSLMDMPSVLSVRYEAMELPYELSYVPDFLVTLSTGKTLIIEAKGYFTAEDRTKMLRVKQKHPDLDIRMVFMGNNKLHAKSKMRYGNWCDKHQIPWAIKEIPESWLQES